VQDEEQLTKYNPFGRGLDNMINFGNKSDLDSLTTEKSYKLSILRILQKGVTAKGSGISGNSGKYILRLVQEKDKNTLERLNMNSKVKEGKEVIMISSIIFRFEYKDLKQNQIAGQTTIVVSFIDKIEWEFKTPRRNKNSFYSCLINLRLNLKDFID
jgi:hypothetical protein